MRSERLIGTIITLAAVLAAFTLVATPADARKKKVQASYTCTCTCASDRKGQGGVPLFTETVSFGEDDALDCLDASGLGGCRIKVGNRYETGTLRNCNYLNPGAQPPGSAGLDPTGGAGPTEPFSRPGRFFFPDP
jgi:hypothetical protein